jgi:hypothetical protein
MSVAKKFDYISFGDGLSVLKGVGRDEIRNNPHKDKREIWCVAKMLEHLSLEYCEIFANPQQSDSTDVYVKDKSSNIEYKIQVAEIAPKSKEAIEFIRTQTIQSKNKLPVYGSLDTFGLICSIIDKKIKKHYSNVNTLNLLVYLNPPVVIIDIELDVDLEGLKTKYQNGEFGSIMLLTNSDFAFIKNEKLV